MNNTSNGFHGGTFFGYPGTFDSDDEKAALMDKLTKLVGSEGPGVMAIAMEEGMNVNDMITNISGNNNDRLFENTTNHVSRTITQNFSLPPQLAGILQEGTVFTQDVIQDGYIYYNIKTKKFRNILARIFKTFGSLWHERK